MADLGQARVEILAVKVDSRLAVNTIRAFDTTKEQIIFRCKEHEEEGKVEPDIKEEGDNREEIKMVPLALTGPLTGISAYGKFGIEVDHQTSAGTVDRRAEDLYDSIYDAEVDDPVTHTFEVHGHRIAVTYMVMSSALEATVQVKLPLIYDPWIWMDVALSPVGGRRYIAHGEIAARIGDWKDHQIVLFRSGPKGKAFKPNSLSLPLLRSVVSVPSGKQLHIEVKGLHISDTSSEQEIKVPKFELSFNYGRPIPTNIAHVDKVEVNVAWFPEQMQIKIEPDGIAKWTIDVDNDKQVFTSFIEDLRIIPAGNRYAKALFEGHPDPKVSSKRNYLVPPGPHDNKKQARWIHIKLQVKEDNGTSSSTTLAVRGNTLYGVGFMNQSRIWYDLGDPHGDKILPAIYKSVQLNWGVSYRSLLNVSEWEEVTRELGSIQRRVKDFAMDAVRQLSRYPYMEDNDDPTLVLVFLLVMICESAKLNPLKKYFEDCWDTKMDRFSQKLMNYIREWGAMSQTLLHWKDHGCPTQRPEEALEVVHLVFNNRQGPDVVYTMDRGSFEFMVSTMKLRDVLAKYSDQGDLLEAHKEEVLKSTRQHPLLPKQQSNPQKINWLRIELRVVEGNSQKSSITLLMKADNLYIYGFVNKDNGEEVCYELLDKHHSVPLLRSLRYKHERIPWGRTYTQILQVNNSDGVVKKLETLKLNKTFAENAVKLLSRYSPKSADEKESREALVGLIIMVCESAKINPIHDHIVRGWKDDKPLSLNLMLDYVLKGKYGRMSQALRAWKGRDYGEPHPASELLNISPVLHEWAGSTRRPRYGRRMVELLAVHANFSNVGNITVFDGKRGQFIYETWYQEEQGADGLLDLTGPYKAISANTGSFTIEVGIPGSMPITWEWDCDNPDHAKEVDNPNPEPRTISEGPGRTVRVSYWVMSNAREATVEVELWYTDKIHNPRVYGRMEAGIGDFTTRRVLRLTQLTSYYRSIFGGRRRTQRLARSVVAVPLDKSLWIHVDLDVVTSDNQDDRQTLHADLEFKDGKIRDEVTGYDVEIIVSITWCPEKGEKDDDGIVYTTTGDEVTGQSHQEIEMDDKANIYEVPIPQEEEPDVVYTMGRGSFEFMVSTMKLRDILAKYSNQGDILDGHKDQVLSSTKQHPLLPKEPSNSKEIKWLRIQLRVVEGNSQKPSITLLMKADNLRIHGFVNKDINGEEVCYELLENEKDSNPMLRSLKYRHECLYWGLTYTQILQTTSTNLKDLKLNETFAEDAVKLLSDFSPDSADEKESRKALGGLMFMVCESAKINPIHDHIVRGWREDKTLGLMLIYDYYDKHGRMSGDLRDWKGRDYGEPHPASELLSIYPVLNK